MEFLTVAKVCDLSSMESEYMAALPAVAEGLFLGSLVKFLTGQKPTISHFTDSAAAVSFTQKSGLQRTRHVDLSFLWLQGLVKEKRLGFRVWG